MGTPTGPLCLLNDLRGLGGARPGSGSADSGVRRLLGLPQAGPRGARGAQWSRGVPSEAGGEAAAGQREGSLRNDGPGPAWAPARSRRSLVGQEHAPVGFHLFQTLHQVAVAHLQLLGFVQCRAKLQTRRGSFKEPASSARDGIATTQVLPPIAVTAWTR